MTVSYGPGSSRHKRDRHKRGNHKRDWGKRDPAGSFSRPEGAHFSRWLIICLVLAGVAVVGVLSVAGHVLELRDSTRDTRLAAIVGPPCPRITLADFIAHQQEAPKVTSFNGLTFARRFGEVSCSVVVAKGDLGGGLGLKSYPVCQFTSPDVLKVQTAKGVIYFEPGLGRKASLISSAGGVRCVMAAPDWS